ncbi:DUF664 domain-containing protein [Brevibacterium daeguense]|uniref:DUF664 domain-containing protein n=1 Tax=Brevibacterium daeguense TaxID=909936 RepID=A0ABP8ELV0_9MICO|nr:DUF664 domain-containing protein [Brevibacterium daeguense]
MNVDEVLLDGFSRPVEVCEMVLDGIDEETLHARLTETSNSIAWLVWHLAREQDVQIAPLAGREQVWTARGWHEQFGKPADDFGFGDTPEDVAAFRVSGPEVLLGYLHEVAEFVQDCVAGLTPEDLAEVIDESWDPPVTRGVRLVSIIDDAAQHAGQAAFVRGALGWDARRP